MRSVLSAARMAALQEDMTIISHEIEDAIPGSGLWDWLWRELCRISRDMKELHNAKS